MTHICVSKLASIVSDNGLSPGRLEAIVWTNAGILLIGPLGTNFSEILIEIHTFSFKKIHFKISSGKWRPFCLGFNVLKNLANLGNVFGCVLLTVRLGCSLISSHQCRFYTTLGCMTAELFLIWWSKIVFAPHFTITIKNQIEHMVQVQVVNQLYTLNVDCLASLGVASPVLTHSYTPVSVSNPEYIYKWVWVIYLFSIFRRDSAILEQSYNRSKSKHVSILHDRLVPNKTQQFLNRVQNFLCTVSLYRLCIWVSFRFLRH